MDLSRRSSRPAHVIFDFDLTLLPEESCLEVLKVATTGHAKEAAVRARLCQVNASSGRLRPAQALGVLSLMQNIRTAHVQDYVQSRIDRLPQELKEVFCLLKQNHISSHILSSAYIEWVRPLAAAWGLDVRNVEANRMLWFRNRALCMKPSPLVSAGGKTKCVRQWRMGGLLKGTVIMIGDGLADRRVYESGEADGFIQADYFTASSSNLPVGNVQRAAKLGELQFILKDMLSLR